MPGLHPKLPSSFHLNLSIHLPCFFPKPHSNQRETALHILDFRWALTFYLDRTKPFWKSPLIPLNGRKSLRRSHFQTMPFKVDLCVYICPTNYRINTLHLELEYIPSACSPPLLLSSTMSQLLTFAKQSPGHQWTLLHLTTPLCRMPQQIPY